MFLCFERVGTLVRLLISMLVAELADALFYTVSSLVNYSKHTHLLSRCYRCRLYTFILYVQQELL